MAAGRQVHAALPPGRADRLLDWDDATIADLVAKAVDVLTRTGLALPDDAEGTYLDDMARRGVRVDRQERMIQFSEPQIAETMAVMRRTGAADRAATESLPSSPEQKRYLVGNGASLLFDYQQWTPRPARTAEFVDIIHWAQGCDTVAEVFAPCAVGDVDQRLAPIVGYALMGRFCHKRFLHEQPTEVVHVKVLDEMARIVETARGFYQPMQEWEYMNPPMRLGLRSIETTLARIDLGLCPAVGIGSMAVRGMTAPITVAGTAVMALAEILAGLTFFHLLRPDVGLRAVAATGAMDMRTGRVSYGGVSVHLQNMALWELLRRGIGAEGGFLTWYRDANEPGMQALYEFGLNQAFFSGIYQRCGVEIGGLACGGSFSPEQAMLDLAAAQEYDQLTDGFPADDAALGVDEILRAGFDAAAHMSSPHTLNHMPDGVAYSDVFLRGLPAHAAHAHRLGQTEDLLTHAAETVKAAQDKGRATDPDEKLGKELDACVKAAAHELGIDPPPTM